MLILRASAGDSGSPHLIRDFCSANEENFDGNKGICICMCVKMRLLSGRRFKVTLWDFDDAR